MNNSRVLDRIELRQLLDELCPVTLTIYGTDYDIKDSGSLYRDDNNWFIEARVGENNKGKLSPHLVLSRLRHRTK